MARNAVIYCRVSSQAQVKKGDGIASQETRCREYARHKDYEVVEVFKDEGISGSMIGRPGMQEMLQFLKKHKRLECVVIIDDISRLARGLEAHIQLRTAIGAAGGKLESPSIEFGEDSDSQLVENLLASVSQHQRQKNAEQVANRMRSRMMNGYWVFKNPIGYRYKHVPGHGKILVLDEPVASTVKEALQSFASGRFETPTEVQRYLEDCATFPKQDAGGIHYQKILEMLERPIYAGYLDYPKWGIHMLPGKHEPLIDFITWQEIMERRRGQAKAPARKNLHDDFPLRGFVVCDSCGNAMTGCWSRGRSGMYAYYHCGNKECSDYKKSIRKNDLEDEFANLLEKLRPTADLYHMARDMLQTIWASHEKLLKQDEKVIDQEIRQIEKKIGQFLDRILECDSPSLISAYENQVKRLEEQKITLREQTRQKGAVLPDFEETFRTAFGFLANPHKRWVSGEPDEQKDVIRLVFADRLPYRRNQGFRTAATLEPFSLLSDLQGGNNDLVEPRRIELLTSTMPS